MPSKWRHDKDVVSTRAASTAEQLGTPKAGAVGAAFPARAVLVPFDATKGTRPQERVKLRQDVATA